MSGSGPMNVFDIAGRAMSAQLVRLNATASNMANAGNVTGTAGEEGIGVFEQLIIGPFAPLGLSEFLDGAD